jgi:hypothetical protein
MMSSSTITTFRITMFRVCAVAAVFAFIACAVPARAADPVFPAGSRFGLVPPPGMLPSKAFNGFADPDKNAAILLVTFPPIAFDQLDKSMVPEELKKQGIDVNGREPITFAFGKGFIVKGIQSTNKGRYRKWLMVAAASDLTALVTVQIPDGDPTYPDKAVHDALASLAVRASVPDAERLGLVPFKVGDFAGFRVDDVMPGSALMLVDGPPGQNKDPSKGPQNAHFIIAAMQGGPAEDRDRDNFARETFDQIGGIKDVEMQDAEPLRLGNEPGYQTLAKAKDSKSGIDIMVVQWLRFGTDGYMQMIGVSTAQDWPNVFTRLRAVRDSIDVN